MQHDTDGDRLGVRVEERTAGHAAGSAEDLEVGTFVAGEREACVDLRPRERKHLLDARA